jgi:uncharacterized protein with HEPN domain
MGKRSVRERLTDVAQAIAKIERYLLGKTFNDFRNDSLTYDAVVRNLEIISEASRHVPLELKQRYTYIAWKQVGDFGNVLRHGYEGLNDVLLWKTFERDLPPLREAVDALLGDPNL